MVVGSNSENYITYYRILSSTTIPYSVDITKSQIFTDPIFSSTRKAYALFIIDLNNVKSLIYDSLNKKCSLAKIDF